MHAGAVLEAAGLRIIGQREGIITTVVRADDPPAQVDAWAAAVEALRADGRLGGTVVVRVNSLWDGSPRTIPAPLEPELPPAIPPATPRNEAPRGESTTCQRLPAPLPAPKPVRVDDFTTVVPQPPPDPTKPANGLVMQLTLANYFEP
jgi:hypothetical protein